VGGTFGSSYSTFIRIVTLRYMNGGFTVDPGYVDLTPAQGFSYFNARFSPNGRWLALEATDYAGGSEHKAIWLVDLSANPLKWSLLINGAGSINSSPAWSPDGSQLAFASNRSKFLNIYVTTLNSDMTAGPSTQLTSSTKLGKVWATWSPDGNQVAYMGSQLSTLIVGKVVHGNATEYTLTDGGWPDWSPP
jgi:TolB protein